jgi:heterodisulfide reductase subunit A-like polyferredoxin
MKKPVLVIGGGIAGIQASLDLAEMGIPVFIVENSPSIGGRMAQLDKTFPTNDCSACILAPKVTSCFNHPLIKTFTWSELLDIKGEEPDFTAVVKKKARFIDEDLCKGCNACVQKCPIERKSEFDMGVGSRRAVYKPFAQAVPNKVVIDKKGTSPCKYNCPAHIDVHGYVALIGQGRYQEALEVVRRSTPFAGVLGRICRHPCETGCSRKYVDSPLALGALKRFIADYGVKSGKEPKIKVTAKGKEHKVVVIGSGPAGMSCAYQLALEGYKVTIFEALPVPGGMLRVGVPDYRLDKKVLEREIQILRDLGVEIICNTPVGKDLTIDHLKEKGYKAFFLAIGTHRDMKLGIPGENSSGVISGIEFLKELNLGKRPEVGKKVIVIGGTNAAIHAARCAIRLGSHVTVVYNGTREQLSVDAQEIKDAMDEGVIFEYMAVPSEVISESGRVTGLRCIKNKFETTLEDTLEDTLENTLEDKFVNTFKNSHILNNTNNLDVSEYADFIVNADTIINAVGQWADTENLSQAGISSFDGRGRNEWGKGGVDTGIPGVFAGGDAVTGPSNMISAVAQGNMAARSIRNYLEGISLPIEPFMLPQTPVEEIDFSEVSGCERVEIPLLEIDRRTCTFEEVEKGLTEELARNEALRCVDCSICCECKICEKVCGSRAIRHEQLDEIIEIPVSSVIFANGYDPVSDLPDGYGYGKYKDVVTSLEYERILSASGPYQGHIKRPSDGKMPERIAFIQCAGSRDEKCDTGYCSAVCCMQAVKESIITREHLSSVKDIDIFYMDMRAYGKDFDKYVDSARNKYGIGFIRSRVSDVEKDQDTGRLIVKYCDEKGGAVSDQYDMVVLSVGLSSNKKMQSLLEKIGVKTDRHGFIWTNEMDAPKSSREGILACGAASEPKDIPETVVEASAAASEASKIAASNFVEFDEYSRFFSKEEELILRDTSKEPVRIGVFVCHCGKNIAGFLDVKEVTKYARTLPYVEYAADMLYACSVDSQKVMAERIKRFNLNRIVVASCTPRTHEPLFQQVLAEAGLNPYLLTMANIRDQCSWVHMEHWDKATEKAKDLVKMAAGMVTHAKQLTRQKVEVTKSALVIGGGVAGMAAALEIAGMGYKVYLVEKNGALGGNGAGLNSTFKGRPTDGYISRMIDEVMGNSLIEVFLNSEIKNVSGYVGKFETIFDREGQEFQIHHGAAIVATGARESKPAEYLYGGDDRILTQMDLEGAIKNNKLDLNNLNNVFMIQCVGSRDQGRPYCSRVCCNQAIKNALLLKEMAPGIKITILYRDVRSYGLNEINYRKARKAGIQFVRYEPDLKPEVSRNASGLFIRFYEPLLDASILSEADLIVLSSAIEPDIESNRAIGQMFKVPLNQEGFFLEAHAKLRPVDFATEGVYLCGLAHAPKTMKESIIQGKAAGARAATVTSKDMLETEGTVAAVSEMLCTGCGACERVCAYGAVYVEEKKKRDEVVRKAVVNPVLCKGCGTCSAACRCGAIDVNGFSDRQVLNEIEYILRM